MQAFAGFDAIPAAAGHALAVVGRHRRHDPVRGVVAPGKPRRGRRLHRLDQPGEEIRLLHRVRIETAALQERIECGLRLRSVGAVDRGSIVAGDDQQPLDAGKPRLFVVILGVLGEIGDEMAVVALRRMNLRERRGRLSGATLPRRRDDEILLGDAERVGAALGRRRGAVEAECARMQEDAIRGQRALCHYAAAGGIDAEPAARGGGGLMVDADGDLDDIAHAIAELQVGMRRRGRNQERYRGGRQRKHGAPRITAHPGAEAAPVDGGFRRACHLWISVPVP